MTVGGKTAQDLTKEGDMSVEEVSASTSPIAHDAAVEKRPPVAVLFGLTFSQLLLVLGWPVVVAGVFFLLIGATKQDLQQVVEGVRVRPPMKVIYVTDRVDSLIKQGASPDEALMQMQREVDALVKAGYIVMDGRSVMGSPEAIEIR